ncbi:MULTISPECIES: helix-turn-helix domain-containing protein [Mycolicibacterium]|uniref:helix-turn-helix domain-containing protein n=1 Tax=Mycolicibacterium TaxID=1866885 RepID=UPI000A8D9935|nr:helix-turn-helix domain-containing protein [Mycolicibacterium fortuitum]MDG5768356.1 helix-turn-helix domain-containing protein [Mycolicibacterium fortuitum]MDG5781146.1 helix-turn-helix domain-containing protein [Mycolicibacterium fortuitum]NOP97128.1 helix-turn-helix domain-containing protein [Mycolicibacterium fortuitum]UHJ54113.1 helix-turn-helix domain-containing protein [Mycolicibacterium fortuitum]
MAATAARLAMSSDCGSLLRLARAEAEMSQGEPAEAAHVAEAVIADIESGALQPSLPELARLIAAVDLELRIRLARRTITTTYSMPPRAA